MLNDSTTARSVHSDVTEVEKQLRIKNKKVSELESRVCMFEKLARMKVPTRDVGCFVTKQVKLTDTAHSPCKKTIGAAMKAKLRDARASLRNKKKGKN